MRRGLNKVPCSAAVGLPHAFEQRGYRGGVQDAEARAAEEGGECREESWGGGFETPVEFVRAFNEGLEVGLRVEEGFGEFEEAIFVEFCEAVEVFLRFVWVGKVHYCGASP